MRNWESPEAMCARAQAGPGRRAGGRRRRLTDNTQTPRPIGGRREACGAWPGFETTRRAKLAARTASGRAGRAAAGDLSGQQATKAGGQAARRPEICRGNKQQKREGRRPPAHTAARPIKADPTAAPATPVGPQAPATQPPGYAKGAGTEVPAPCRLTQPLPRRGLRPNDRQSWRRRRIHRNMPPTTAAPRPAPPIRPSKPVRARPRFGLVAGTSGAT